MAFNDRIDVRRRRRSRPENASRSHSKRKIQAVTQAVGKKQLGHAEETIVFRDSQNVLGVEFSTYHHVMVKVHTALRKTGAAGRV